MTDEHTNSYSRVTETEFHCSICNGSLSYVQLFCENRKLKVDYFQCETCGNKVEIADWVEEDMPAFYD